MIKDTYKTLWDKKVDLRKKKICTLKWETVLSNLVSYFTSPSNCSL